MSDPDPNHSIYLTYLEAAKDYARRLRAACPGAPDLQHLADLELAGHHGDLATRALNETVDP